jgi:hypothetical protein
MAAGTSHHRVQLCASLVYRSFKDDPVTLHICFITEYKGKHLNRIPNAAAAAAAAVCCSPYLTITTAMSCAWASSAAIQSEMQQQQHIVKVQAGFGHFTDKFLIKQTPSSSAHATTRFCTRNNQVEKGGCGSC